MIASKHRLFCIGNFTNLFEAAIRNYLCSEMLERRCKEDMRNKGEEKLHEIDWGLDWLSKDEQLPRSYLPPVCPMYFLNKICIEPFKQQMTCGNRIKTMWLQKFLHEKSASDMYQTDIRLPAHAGAVILNMTASAGFQYNDIA